MVRFIDGPATEVTAEVPSPPEAVWPHVLDVALPVGASGELRGTEWLDGATGPAVGAVFRGRNRRGEVAWETDCTVIELDPPHRFTWRVDPVGAGGPAAGADAIATWGFELAAAPDGGSVVRQWTVLGPGRSGLTWAIRQDPDREEEIIAARLASLRDGMTRTLEALAARVSAAG